MSKRVESNKILYYVKRRNCFYALAFFILLLLPNFVSGQDTLKKVHARLIFWIDPLYYNALKFQHSTSPGLRSHGTPSAEAGMGIDIPINRKTGIQLGAAMSLLQYHFYFDYKAKFPFDTNLISDYLNYYEYFITYYSYSASIYHTVKVKDKYPLRFEVGGKMNIIPPFEIEVGYTINNNNNNSRYDLFDFYLVNNSYLKLYSTFSRVTYQWTTPRQNDFGLGLTFQCSPQKAGNGYYVFREPIPSNGNVLWGINYIGLSMKYGNAVVKKRRKS